MNAPSFHYIHSDQWRYDRAFKEVCPVADSDHPMAHGHTIDKNILAVRNGWLPCYPQFDRSSFDVVREAESAGATTDAEVVSDVVARLKSRSLKFSIEDPERQARYAAVFAIIAGAFVPLNFMAVRMAESLVHPRVLSTTGGSMPGSMRLTFLVSLAGMACLFVTLWKYELASKHATFRLRALKRVWDPDNFFRRNVNILPA